MVVFSVSTCMCLMLQISLVSLVASSLFVNLNLISDALCIAQAPELLRRRLGKKGGVGDLALPHLTSPYLSSCPAIVLLERLPSILHAGFASRPAYPHSAMPLSCSPSPPACVPSREHFIHGLPSPKERELLSAPRLLFMVK